MKKVFLTLLVFAASSAQAKVFFSGKTPLTAELKSAIAEKISEKCQVQNSVISEADTEVVDFYYTSKFSVQGYDSDGFHPRGSIITVESALYALKSGPHYEVVSVQGVLCN